MGRWAQYRKRGRGVGGLAGFPLDPPVWEVKWNVVPDTDHWQALTDGSYPAPAELIRIRYRKNGGSPVDDTVLGPGSDVLLVAGGTGDTLEVSARYETGGELPLSDWSAPQDPGGI